MRVSLSARGDGIAAARLRRLAANAENAAPVFRAIARILMEGERERFARSGPGWRLLDPDTIRKKARANPPQDPRTMRATGTLERALTVWGAPGQYLDVRPLELVFGLEHAGEAYYGAFSQRGEGQPKRRVVGVSRTTRDRVFDAMRAHLTDHGGPLA